MAKVEVQVNLMLNAWGQEDLSRVVDPDVIEKLVRILVARHFAQAVPVLEAHKVETQRGFIHTGQQVASLASEVEKLHHGQGHLAQQTLHLHHHTTQLEGHTTQLTNFATQMGQKLGHVEHQTQQALLSQQ